MPRTDTTAVQGILLDHYDGESSLTPFIDTATLVVDKIAANDSGSELTAADLEMIERYLAAHFYAHADQLLQSKSTGGASGQFQGRTDMGYDGTLYGQTAKRMDVTGYLARIDMPMRPKAGAAWLGKVPSQQIDYEDRA
ncbi:MAG: hypothetical protein WC485_00215 [Opitutaceae bacterium]